MLPSPADCAGKERVLQLASTSTLQQVFSNECTFAALRVDGSVITWGDPDGSGDSSNVSEFLEAGVREEAWRACGSSRQWREMMPLVVKAALFVNSSVAE